MRVFISTYDKTDLEKLISGLDLLCAEQKEPLEIVSTGGTSRYIRENTEIEPTDVSEVTGFPEILGGRVKTLHPKIHGGILSRRFNKEDRAELKQHEIDEFDLVVCNLYPFEEAAKQDIPLEELLEQIDIGGVTLLRATAKNMNRPFVVSSPEQYADFLTTLSEGTDIEIDVMREEYAIAAFGLTFRYDQTIHAVLSERKFGEETLNLHYGKGRIPRYGENPHQKSIIYTEEGLDPDFPCIPNATQLHGKEMSYNNVMDADAAVRLALELQDENAAIIIKHSTACGVATGKNQRKATEKAHFGDPTSAYGSILCVTRPMTLETTEFLREKWEGQPKFIEVVIAPSYEEGAVESLKRKGKNVRILELPQLKTVQQMEYRSILGGMLAQTADNILYEKWETVTETPFPEELRGVAEFGIKVVKYLKSNALGLYREYQPGCYYEIAMGTGQPNRVNCLENLILPTIYERFVEPQLKKLEADSSPEEWIRARPTMRHMCMKAAVCGSVLVSEAFLPYPDVAELAGKYGIHIIQPGGSKGDQESIDAANKYGVSMVFTGTRHFRH